MANGHSFNDNDFGEHYRNRYGRTGRPYQDFQPAYRFGWEMAHEQRYHNRDWNALEQDARSDWEQRTSRQRWEEMRDAVMEGFNRGRGVRRTNFGAMEGPGSGGTQAHQVSSGVRSGGTGDITHAPQGSGTYPSPARDADEPTINEGVVEGSLEPDQTRGERPDEERGDSPEAGDANMSE